MRRLGILGHGFVDWAGGLDFLRTVVDSLVATNEPVELHLLLPTRGPRLALRRAGGGLKRSVKKVLGRQVASVRRPEAPLIDEFATSLGSRLTAHRIDIGDEPIHACAHRLGLSALLPSLYPLPASLQVPWLGYIADFQHRHLPAYFSADECAARDRAYVDMLARARTVIVNSRAVARDATVFAPACNARIVALPFGAAPQPEWFEPDAVAPAAKHGIDGPYFMVCNQFWQHKDHATAWRAFARLLHEEPSAHLVCTGETSDYRHPGHFENLQRSAEALGIARRLHVLGLLSKREQVQLLRCAVAVLQPTLYEGGPGGGAVYDAVALGVPAIVSDLPVNTEIDEPGVAFFRAGDDLALADAMRTALRSQEPRPDARTLIEAGRRRRAACGRVLLDAIAANPLGDLR